MSKRSCKSAYGSIEAAVIILTVMVLTTINTTQGIYLLCSTINLQESQEPTLVAYLSLGFL